MRKYDLEAKGVIGSLNASMVKLKMFTTSDYLLKIIALITISYKIERK